MRESNVAIASIEAANCSAPLNGDCGKGLSKRELVAWREYDE